ncbi:cytochrome c [Rhodobium orientis]|uniref:Cytochrome c2 n=1 Tax=Rhodobium orientis TaxID=34017 RepID=A0A327JNX3_9HYPH|nr:cytochrome c family protein [Rhodobium orientis]MBB4304150.1 cytochrome c [Rhodobium orientis]MBK5950621.1 cytochrome C [Rhodobium orientis]RAI28007.1 cytochrome C [Rhodobium orientis]
MKGLIGIGIAAALTIAATGAASAAGDAAKGEKVAKKCVACHTFEEGGKNKVGPNLWGIVGRTAGTHEGYKYSDSYVSLGEGGMTWTEENIAAYVPDPKGFIREKTGDPKARSKMTFKLTKDEDIADVIAYLATLK